MSKRKPTKNLPLFADMPDAQQVHGFKTADEREYEKQQQRKRKRKFVPLAKAPANGPACLRCVHWIPPGEDDEFGECRYLVKTVDDAPWMNMPAGTITDRDFARKDLRVQFDYLRTGEAFKCSACKRALDVEAA